MHFEQTADNDTVSTYQVSLVQLVTDKKLEALNKYLWNEVGTATLINTFIISTGGDTPCLGIIAPYLGETFFLFCVLIAL